MVRKVPAFVPAPGGANVPAVVPRYWLPHGQGTGVFEHVEGRDLEMPRHWTVETARQVLKLELPCKKLDSFFQECNRLAFVHGFAPAAYSEVEGLCLRSCLDGGEYFWQENPIGAGYGLGGGGPGGGAVGGLPAAPVGPRFDPCAVRAPVPKAKAFVRVAKGLGTFKGVGKGKGRCQGHGQEQEGPLSLLARC